MNIFYDLWWFYNFNLNSNRQKENVSPFPEGGDNLSLQWLKSKHSFLERSPRLTSVIFRQSVQIKMPKITEKEPHAILKSNAVHLVSIL